MVACHARARSLRQYLSYDPDGPTPMVSAGELDFLKWYHQTYETDQAAPAERASVGPFTVETLLGDNDDPDVVAAREASQHQEPGPQNY